MLMNIEMTIIPNIILNYLKKNIRSNEEKSYLRILKT